MGSFRQVAFERRLQEIEQEKRVDRESQKPDCHAGLDQSATHAIDLSLANSLLLLQLRRGHQKGTRLFGRQEMEPIWKTLLEASQRTGS